MSLDASKSKPEEQRPAPQGKGYWAAHAAGFCAVAFSLACGAGAAPIMAGSRAWQAWLAVPLCIAAADWFSRGAGQAAGSEFKDPAEAQKAAAFTRSIILFAALATGFGSFVAMGEAEKYKALYTREHNAAAQPAVTQPAAQTPAQQGPAP